MPIPRYRQLALRLRAIHRSIRGTDLITLNLSSSPPFVSIRRPLADSTLPIATQQKIHSLAHQITWRTPEYDDCIQHLAAAARADRQHPRPSGNPLDLRGKQRKTFIRDKRAAYRAQRHWISRYFSKTWRTLLLLILLTTSGSMIAMFFSEPTLEVNHLDLINAPACAIPEQDRAWPLYRDALCKLPLPADHQSHWLDYGTRPVDPRWAQTISFLEEHQNTIDELLDAAKRPGMGWTAFYEGNAEAGQTRSLVPQKHGHEPLFPNAVHSTPHHTIERYAVTFPSHTARGLSTIFRAALHQAAEQKKIENVVEVGSAWRQFGSHLAELGLVMHHVRAAETHAQVYSDLAVIVHQSDWIDSEGLDTLNNFVENWPSSTHVDVGRLFLLMKDALQRTYTRHGTPSWRLWGHLFGTAAARDSGTAEPTIGHRVASSFIAPMTFLLTPTRRPHDAEIRRQITLTANLLKTPLHDLTSEEVDSQWDAFDDQQSLLNPEWIILTAARPHARTLTQPRAEANAARDTLLLTLALHRHHADQGTWPTSLHDLVPTYLTGLPPDPINGEILGYRIVDGRPLVYSVGSDGDDDGGRPPMIDPDSPYGSKTIDLDNLDPDVNYEPGHDAARHWHDPNPADGDWILYPWPPDPPAELPEPYDPETAPFSSYGTYGGY